MGGATGGRSLEETSRWAVAAVCLVLVATSMVIERLIHLVEQGKVPFVSSDGIHQLHVFIFVLALFHVLCCILTMTLGRFKGDFLRKKAYELLEQLPCAAMDSKSLEILSLVTICPIDSKFV
ncbi:hypothetical protein LguiB_000964 [Lonicera macranthoides]